MDGGAVSLAVAIEGDPAISTLVEYAVPKASVKDVSMPGTAIGFDPHHLMRSVGELFSVMAKAEFRDFSVPEIAFSQNVPTPGAGKGIVRGVYRNLTMAGMTNGVAGRTEAGPILFSGPVPEGGEFGSRWQRSRPARWMWRPSRGFLTRANTRMGAATASGGRSSPMSDIRVFRNGS